MFISIQSGTDDMQSQYISQPAFEKEEKCFNLAKMRRVVERTFAWIFNLRRNLKDYEILTRKSGFFWGNLNFLMRENFR